MVDESWRDDYQEFTRTLLPLLKEHGHEIGRDTSELAGKIRSHYGMLARSFDPITHMVLREEVTEWLKERHRKGAEGIQ